MPAPSTQHPAPSTQHPAPRFRRVFPQRLFAWFVAGLLGVVSLLQAKSALADYLRFDIRFPAVVALALFAIELFVATLVLGFPGRRCSWIIVTCLFLGFTSVATARALSGVRDCGCFGEVSVAPKATASFDAIISIVAMLGVWSTRYQSNCTVTPLWSMILHSGWRSLVATGVGLAVVFGSVQMKFGSDNIGFGLSRPYAELGVTILDQNTGVFTTSLPIHNSGSETVRIYGCESNCSTRCLAKLPVDVPKGT